MRSRSPGHTPCEARESKWNEGSISDPPATLTCSGIVWPNSFVTRLMTPSHPTKAGGNERAPPATAATFIHSRRAVVIALLRKWLPYPARMSQREMQAPVRAELATQHMPAATKADSRRSRLSMPPARSRTIRESAIKKPIRAQRLHATSLATVVANQYFRKAQPIFLQ